MSANYLLENSIGCLTKWINEILFDSTISRLPGVGKRGKGHKIFDQHSRFYQSSHELLSIRRIGSDFSRATKLWSGFARKFRDSGRTVRCPPLVGSSICISYWRMFSGNFFSLNKIARSMSEPISRMEELRYSNVSQRACPKKSCYLFNMCMSHLSLVFEQDTFDKNSSL